MVGLFDWRGRGDEFLNFEMISMEFKIWGLVSLKLIKD